MVGYVLLFFIQVDSGKSMAMKHFRKGGGNEKRRQGGSKNRFIYKQFINCNKEESG